MNFGADVWSAIFAGLTCLLAMLTAAIGYGLLKQSVTDHDKRLTSLESDGKSQQQLLAGLTKDIAVVTSQLTDVKHDVRNIESSLSMLTKMALEDRARLAVD